MKKTKELTKIQQDTFNFIVDYLKKNQYQPSYRDMMKYFNISIGSIVDRLLALEKKGYIKRTTKNRGMTICK